VALCLSLGLVAAAAYAQSRRGTGSWSANAQPDVEVIGLQRWTRRMIDDSLAKYAPGVSLATHACAAVLENTLGFPAVSVEIRTSRHLWGSCRHTVVT